MTETKCDLLIIGGGPGGYVCGIRAGQLGVDTIVVEAEKPGGTCLNVGCIPSKALIHVAEEYHRLSAFAEDSPIGIHLTGTSIDLAKSAAWSQSIVERLNRGVAGLLKKAGAKLVLGRAAFLDGKTVRVEGPSGDQTISAKSIVVATGSAPVELPNLPFGGKVISSTDALSLTEVPATLAVIGGGYIGLEIGTAYAKFGSQVTVIEALDRVLPQYDAELIRPVQARLKALGVTVLTKCRADGLTDAGRLRILSGDEEREEIDADKVLVTVGRRPVTDGCGLEDLRLDMRGKFIAIDDKCRTSMRGVYAIGDVTGEPMLAHRAMAQGEMVAEIIAGLPRAWDRRCIPAVCFTDPELVTVGLSPDEAATAGDRVETGMFPFLANGRAMTKESEAGMVRVVFNADDHVILGIQAVGTDISELSAAFALAIETGARLEDVAGTIHAHPTTSEAFQEAAFKGLGHALHI